MKYLTQISSKDSIEQLESELMASKELDKSRGQNDRENIKIYSEKDQNV